VLRNHDAEVQRPRSQSLAQAARGKHLNTARNVLIAIGVLTILFNVFFLFQVPSQVRMELNQELARQRIAGNAADRPQAEQLMLMVSYAVHGGTILLGVVFIVCGLLVKRFPVVVTILSLVLYVASVAVFGVLNPATIPMGLVFKIIVVICLVKAVQSAFAYQREQALEARRLEFADDFDYAPAEPIVLEPAPTPRTDPEIAEAVQPEGARPVSPRSAIVPSAAEPIPLGEERVQATPAIVQRAPAVPAQPTPPPVPAVERSTDLFGREFIINLGRPWLGFLFAGTVTVGLAIVSVAVVGRLGLVCAASYAVLLVLAAVVFFTRARTRLLRFTVDGIELTRPDEQLAYDQIVEIYTPDQTGRRRGNFAIHLLHTGGTLTILPEVEADSQELLDFLETQPLGAREIAQVDPSLRDFVKQQVTVHGKDAVYVYRARRRISRGPVYNSALWCSLTFVVLGIGVGALGILGNAPSAMGVAVGVTLLGILLCVFVVTHYGGARPPIKKWQEASLVIGPDGLALMQGTLTGELRWRELKSVKMGKGQAAHTAGGRGGGHVPGIVLQVPGATIVIADIYHWPLSHAMEQIRRHWDGQ
jgi:hypothetical protein